MNYAPTTEKILAAVNKLTVRHAWRLVEVLGTDMSISFCKLITKSPVSSPEEILERFIELGLEHDQALKYSIELVEYVDERIREKEIKKLEERKLRTERKLANRACYLPEPLFQHYQTKDGLKRWHADADLRSGGLLPLVLRDQHPEISIPYTMGFLNNLPVDENEQAQHVDPKYWDKLNKLGVAVSGQRLGWNMNTPAWNWLLKCFPNAIDLAAYNHSLNAPVYPGGFFKDIQVVFKKLTNSNGEDLKTDGSGIYHPNCPELKFWVEKHGACPIQVRFLTEDGIFAKGVLFPDMRALHEGKESIVFDLLQVKGAKKGLAKKMRTEGKSAVKTGHLGAIQYWNRKGTLKACFELLENIQLNTVTSEIIQKYVEIAMRTLQAEGIDGLLREVARDDERQKLLFQLVTAIRASGVEVHPTQIPMIRSSLKLKLGRKLWHITQGAGIEFDRYVARLDNTVPEGKCILSGFPGGVKVVGFRFPIVLGQGLLSLETIDPRGEDLLDNGEVPFQVVMNPRDATLRAQGDDDGDTFGFSANPDMVELFSHLEERRLFQVEPEATPMNIKSDSAEGLKYLQAERTGIVGFATIWRAQLLAVGDIMAANAMSIVIQENIDCAKKKVTWSDFRAAAEINNWHQDENGVHHFKKAYVDEDGTYPDEFPTKHCSAWVRSRIQRATGIEKPHQLTILGWRQGPKRINIEDFHPTSAYGWNGGNLVHHCHDHAHAVWQEIAEQFDLSGEANEQLRDILPKLFQAKSIPVSVEDLPDAVYQSDLYAKSGLQTYNDGLRKILERAWSSEEEKAKRTINLQDNLNEQLKKLNVQELCQIWYSECSRSGDDRDKGINNAFRAISFPGSPVLTLLGINTGADPECQFLNAEKVDTIINRCIQAERPEEALMNVIYTSTKHGEQVKTPEGEPIHGYQCSDCQKKLHDALVRKIRNVRTTADHQFIKKLIPLMKLT